LEWGWTDDLGNEVGVRVEGHDVLLEDSVSSQVTGFHVTYQNHDLANMWQRRIEMWKAEAAEYEKLQERLLREMQIGVEDP
jgi:hypothetical protein